MNNVLNGNLVSFFRVNIRNKSAGWQPLNLLLDTGFNGEIELNAGLLAAHDLETRPDHQVLTPAEILANPDLWNPMSPYKGTIEWEGRERIVGIRPSKSLAIHGMLGTELLKWRRLTVDVIEGGAVTIESIPPHPSKSIFSWRSQKAAKREPVWDDLGEYINFLGSSLPLTEIHVQDNKGKLHSILVNVDTGNNQELNLPFRMVDALRLTATEKTRMNSPDGLVPRPQGEAEIIWLGKKLRVKCLHWPDDKPPHIGMKLLKGNRLTVDFDEHMPRAIISRIPRPASSVRRFLHLQ